MAGGIAKYVSSIWQNINVCYVKIYLFNISDHFFLYPSSGLPHLSHPLLPNYLLLFHEDKSYRRPFISWVEAPSWVLWVICLFFYVTHSWGWPRGRKWWPINRLVPKYVYYFASHSWSILFCRSAWWLWSAVSSHMSL